MRRSHLLVNIWLQHVDVPQFGLVFVSAACFAFKTRSLPSFICWSLLWRIDIHMQWFYFICCWKVHFWLHIFRSYAQRAEIWFVRLKACKIYAGSFCHFWHYTCIQISIFWLFQFHYVNFGALNRYFLRVIFVFGLICVLIVIFQYAFFRHRELWSFCIYWNLWPFQFFLVFQRRRLAHRNLRFLLQMLNIWIHLKEFLFLSKRA